MRREIQPSPMGEAMPVLLWCVFFMAIGGIGRWWELFWISLVIFIGHAAFHRNPRRTSSEDASILVAPADGVVTDVIEIDEPKFIRGKAWRVGIFLSVFDVHTQPSPCDATLRFVEYQPGKFYDARDLRASPQNESQILGLETPDGVKFVVRQISGMIARRIVLFRQTEEKLKRGELLGMIRYGSRVELYLPFNAARILVKPGERMRGVHTPIAQWMKK